MSWVSQDDRSLWTITATFSSSGNPATYAADGNTGTDWVSGESIPQSLIIDRGGNSGTSIDTVVITPSVGSGDNPLAATFWHSDDGSSWAQIGSGSDWPRNNTERYANFTSTTKRWFKATFTASTGGWVRVAEIYLGTGTPGNVRVTQAAVEIAYAADAKVRATQVAVDVAFTANPKICVTQVAVEIAFRNPKAVYPKIQQFILP